MGRLGGRGRVSIEKLSPLTTLHAWQLPSMTEAIRLACRPIWKSESGKDRDRKACARTALTGNEARLKTAMGLADSLVESAIACDPRLANKPQWLRRDEGEHVDAGLLAEGDDQPFYKRTRTIENNATRAGKPVRVVISTDLNRIVPGTAAAFIATARLAQQFVPLEIWWQGAWLTPDHMRGYVFHVPLVTGDMDFSRLEYCIADTTRDTFSFMVMATHATYTAKETWNGCGTSANYSHHPDPDAKFISHTGIEPTGERIARHAANWIGLDPLWSLEVGDNSAEQRIPSVPRPYTGPTAEDIKRWEIEEKQRDEAAAILAKARLASV